MSSRKKDPMFVAFNKGGIHQVSTNKGHKDAEPWLTAARYSFFTTCSVVSSEAS